MTDTAAAALRHALPLLVLLFGALIGCISASGVLSGLVFIALVLHGRRWMGEVFWNVLILVASIALAAHVVPGFLPLNVRTPYTVSADAPPYQLRLSWDKCLVGAALLGLWPWGAPARGTSRCRIASVCIATLIGVPALAMLIGVVGWQPKWPEILPVWLAINLGVAVLAEELIFRGMLQGLLVQRCGAVVGIGLTAVLFGLVHVPFSASFALVAAVAGLGYGLAYHYSGRLSIAIALHAAVNLLHFLLLSYPIRIA
ncbi:CPBP family intramembrane glutamic endopeptidase [Pseudomonas matsuisoli]|uniref:CAAX protease family protein n=1 Tax=Pseudomonas matsuisoli TaxID=1515666 RepID=A0A917PZC7_9PSED|nr:CPBP family intramembrane glutamic endopeptidase [Pseudomonas matsuisoli]GGK00611.1 CAAX protease family protein [Pseudomonas matsuisoli]